jgi:hypothetical protein
MSGKASPQKVQLNLQPQLKNKRRNSQNPTKKVKSLYPLSKRMKNRRVRRKAKRKRRKKKVRRKRKKTRRKRKTRKKRSQKRIANPTFDFIK